jgi:Glycosyltransferase
MKVLLIHNEYGKYCGEEAVVDKMDKMLSANGHEVRRFTRSSAEIPQMFLGKVRAFFAALFNPMAFIQLRRVLNEFQPDIVNVHNLYPFISPAILFYIRKRSIPVVMTIHNFRLMCPTGLFMRDGLPCENCLHGYEWNCVRYNCEHSISKSTGYALRNWFARVTGAYLKCVDRYACITDFQRRKMILAGFPADRIEVIPNFQDKVDDPTPIRGSYVGYSGRISYEKGVDMIIEVARRHPEIPFVLAGEIRKETSGKMLQIHDPQLPNIRFAGYLQGEELTDFYENARFTVMASRWYEGFPMTILDAASFSKPTIGPDQSGFREIIHDKPQLDTFKGVEYENTGILFRPLNVDDLEQKIVWLWTYQEVAEKMGQNAFRRLKSKYTTEAVSKQWEMLLQRMISDKSCSHERIFRHTVRV